MRLRLKQLAQDGATSGQAVVWNGSAWVPSAPAGALPAATVKGTLAVFNGTAWVALTPGSNGQVLTADSSATTGLRWSTASTSAPVGYADIYSDTYGDAATGIYSDLYNGSY